MTRELGLIMMAIAFSCVVRCDSDNSTGAGRGSDSGGAPDALSPKEEGGVGPGTCPSRPERAFDPRRNYVAPALTPTLVVTSAANDGGGSLRQALGTAAPGAVIGFDPQLAGRTIALDATLTLTKSVTITGAAAPGMTIDAQHHGSAFQYGSDSPTILKFFALRIVNGRTTGSGGAISLNGNDVDLEIGGCTFENNAANEGGALRVGYRRKTASIHDSVFIGNDGAFPGGDRGGFSGGAISAIGPTLRITRCRFEANKGVATGAVYTIHADPLVEDSVFIGNRSTGASGSGAFFADGGGPGDYNTDYTNPANNIPGQITLRRTRFDGNRGAGDDSGAVEAYAYPLDTVTFEDSVFVDNISDPGRAGAAFIHSDHIVRIARTAFVGNRATGVGGAIWADGNGHYDFENALFSGNVASGDFGGALRMNITQTARLRIVSSTFVDNTAGDANGAMWIAGRRDARISNSIFANNTFRGGGQQINFPVDEGGGNIEWPAPLDADKALAMARNVDPMLATLAEVRESYARMPGANSPALRTAVAPSPATDLFGAIRGVPADVGAFEAGGHCP